MSTDNQYADRDAMWLDQQGGHYIRHVDHMTREGLHSKSDIAAELGWRDLQIQELTQQLSAKTISEQNIINAFGISGEGAHSKLVIEYVHGLVAENAALKAAFNPVEIPEDAVDALGDTAEFDWDSNESGSWTWIENDTDVIRAVLDAMPKPETPATDSFTAELRAQGVDAFAESVAEMHSKTETGSRLEVQLAFTGDAAVSFAANLRAGRKG